MSGFLDGKERVLDTIVTNEGRRQMALGRINIRYATFTDQDAFYEFDPVSGTTDAALRPHLEAFNRPQDTISFESDDVGNLLQFDGSTNGGVIGGHVLVTSGSQFLNFLVDPDERRRAQYELLSSSFDNFRALYTIGTKTALHEDATFELSDSTVEFVVTNDILKDKQGFDVVSIDDAGSLFQDRRISHAPNFKYLPPRNSPTQRNPAGSPLGTYPRLDQGEVLTFDELIEDLSRCQRHTIRFVDTSDANNVFGQFFELRNDVIKKLDVIDFGEFIDFRDGSSKHVFFVGRLFVDSNGTHTFINIFTLIFT